MIDAHVHFWEYDKIKDSWITDEMKLLQSDFLAYHLQPVLKENNINGVVAIQADQSEKETLFLLGLARENAIIKGIVGWIDLQNENLENELFYYSKYNIIKGFRHLVQDEPHDFLQNKRFQNGIKALQVFGFTYDILIYENQLKQAVEFVNKFPDQKFIMDHCAKPSIKNNRIKEWRSLINEMAKNENVFCKLSGLITEAKWNCWKEKDFYPYLDVVFESFGTDRLLFGSDWPVMLVSGTYNKWKKLLENYMINFSIAEKQKVFEENAIKFYNLNSQTP